MRHPSYRSNTLSIVSVLLLFLAIQGCQWHADEYNQYAGDRGYIEPCVGFCISDIDSQEKCQKTEEEAKNDDDDSNPYHWLKAFCLDTQGNILKDISQKEDCISNHGTWFPGQCKILSKDACDDRQGEWISFELYYKGDNEYIQAVDGAYYCGTFNDIVKDKAPTCPDINQYIEDISIGLCNANSFCQSIPLNDRTVAACSICPPNHAICNGNCVDIMDDSKNCGTCNHVCDEENGDICINGKCDYPCTKETDKTCIVDGKAICIRDINTNPHHCGDCDNACASGRCNDGNCE